MTRTIDVSDLPEPLVAAIESMVSTYRAKSMPAAERRPPRPVGWLRGKVEVPDSFFDPLPDDLLDLFEGRGPDPEPVEGK
jgi:hypothetical protein